MLNIASYLFKQQHIDWATVFLGCTCKCKIAKKDEGQFYSLVAQCLSKGGRSAALIGSAAERAGKSSYLPADFARTAKHNRDKAKEFDLAAQATKTEEQMKDAFARRSYPSIFLMLMDCWESGDKPKAKIYSEHLKRTLGPHEQLLPGQDCAVLNIAMAVYHLLCDDVNTALRLLALSYLKAPFSPDVSSIVPRLLSAETVRVKGMHGILDQLHSLSQWLANNEQLSYGDSKFITRPLPAEPIYHKALRKNAPMVAFRRCEVASLRHFSKHEASPQDVALFYVDMHAPAPDAVSTCMTFLHAARYFLCAAQTSNKRALQYANKMGMRECLSLAAQLSSRQSPYVRITIAKYILNILAKAVQSLPPLFSPEDKGGPHYYCYTQPIFPAVAISLDTLACDSVYVGVVLRQLSEKVLLTSGSGQSSLVLPSTLSYYVFEGYWQNWIGVDMDSAEPVTDDAPALADRTLIIPDETEEQREERILEAKQKRIETNSRETCIAEMLHNKGWNAHDVEKLVQWLPVPRDNEGFLLPKAHSLGPDMTFSSFDGFTFDEATGDLKIMTRNQGTGLFGYADIRDVLQNGITSSFFSLDQPGRDSDGQLFESHPFQEMVYNPAGLRGTSYLATMFHTDYLLKFFSCGIEVSGSAPFKQRPTSAGLLKRLPPSLCKSLQPIVDPKLSSSQRGKAHRFWIDAGTIERDLTETGSVLECRFGRVPMAVKKHLLMLNEKVISFIDHL
jgi:hypothetical protein